VLERKVQQTNWAFHRVAIIISYSEVESGDLRKGSHGSRRKKLKENVFEVEL